MSATGDPMRKPGKSGPAASRFLIQDLRSGTSPKNHPGKTKPSASRSSSHSQRVRDSRFFGASPVASALDLRTGRDPDANHLTVSRSARWEVHRLLAFKSRRLALMAAGGVKEPCPGGVHMAGFETSTYGRFCGDHRGSSSVRFICRLAQKYIPSFRVFTSPTEKHTAP